jgi:hypothetical protein
MRSQLEGSLFEFPAGLLPYVVKEIEREITRQRYGANAFGNLAGFAIACGLDDASIEPKLPEIVRALTVRALNGPQRRFVQSVPERGSGSGHRGRLRSRILPADLDSSARFGRSFAKIWVRYLSIGR